jgi:EamA-like transporter family
VKLLPAAAAAATGIQVGSAIVATRYVVDQTGPVSLALLRYLIGFCCLLPPVLLSARPGWFARRDLPAIALLGITQFGILIALLNYGVRSIPAARAALVFATFPLLTSLVARWLLSLAVGAEPCDTHAGHGVPGAQSRHGGRPGRLAPRRARLAAARGRAHLGRRWPRPRTPAQPRGPGHPA